MDNSNINILGVLNSISSDHTIAKANQIEMTLDDGSKTKITDEILKRVKAATSDEINNFYQIAVNNEKVHYPSRLFICTKALDSSKKAGHFYFYDDTTKMLSDITPAMGGGSTGGDVILNVSFVKSTVETNTEIEIPFSWTSSNGGYGFTYCFIDKELKERIREQPGKPTKWVIPALSRGVHELSMYTVDADQKMSERWVHIISVGSLEIQSEFSDNKIFPADKDILIPFTYYSDKKDANLTLEYSINTNNYIQHLDADKENSSLALSVSNLQIGMNTVELVIKSVLNDEIKYSNKLKYNILIAAEGVLYVSKVLDDPSAEIDIKENKKNVYSVRATYLGAKKFTASFQIFKETSPDNYVEDSSLPNATWSNGINSFLISFAHKGKYKLLVTVTYNENVSEPISEYVEYIFNVTQSEEYNIKPIIDTNLMLHLSAGNRTNNDTDHEIWKDTSVDEIKSEGYSLEKQPVNVTLHNFNFSSNGWFYDEKLEQSKLVIDSGAYVEIDLRPFDHEIGSAIINGNKENGFTFDIEFATKDILNYDARVVSCFNDNAEAKEDKRGFWINTEFATLSNNNNRIKNEIIEKEYKSVIGKDENGNDIVKIIKQQVQIGPFQTPFPAEKKNRITFVINRGKETEDKKEIDYGDYQFACMCIYVNGVLTSVEEITDLSQFENIGQKIYLGCDNALKNTGYCEIYNLRAYSRALSPIEVLTNYVADIPNSAQRSEMIAKNRLIKDAIATSDLPKMYFILKQHDAKVMSKKNKVWGKIIYSDNDTTKNFTSYMQCGWQGTSSLAYAVKNYKVKLYETLKYEKDSSGKELFKGGDKKFKYDLGNGIKESKFCLKADYMDSAHMRNTGTATFVTNFGTELCPVQEFIPASRTAIYGYPILLYLQYPKNEDASLSDLEGDSNKEELLGVFNFNLDKGCTNSLSLYTKNDMDDELKDSADYSKFKSDYPNWDCMSMEGTANSDNSAGAFYYPHKNPIPTQEEEVFMNQSVFDDFELRFEDMDDLEEDGDILHTGTLEIHQQDNIINIDNFTFMKKGSPIPSDINVEFSGQYEIDSENNMLRGLRYDLVKETNDLKDGVIDGIYDLTFDWKYPKAEKENPELNIGKFVIKNNIITYNETYPLKLNRRYSHIKKLIRWVSDSDEDTFRKEFHKHFYLNGTVDYFLIVFTMLMADNLGKNCMWNTWGPISLSLTKNNSDYVYTKEEIRKYDNYIWVPQFYDMDTCLGLDNAGNMRFDVYEEIEPGVFNTSGSRFWTKFKHQFGGTIFGGNHASDSDYEDANANSPIVKRYRQKRKYLNSESTFTVNSFLDYFYTNQIAKISEIDYNFDIIQKYLKHKDYLFMCHGSQYEFFLRWISQRLYFLDTVFEFGTAWEDQSTVRVEYNNFDKETVKFNIQTYQPAYVLVKFTAAKDKWHKLKVPRNTSVLFEDKVKTATDQEVIIFNAGNIKTLGDLSPYTPKSVILDKMVKLTELIVGSETNPNPNLSEISLANNTYLTKLVADNCTACSSTVNLENCKNLKYVSTKGSSIKNIKFSKAGGALEELHLSNATSTIDVSNFELLHKIDIEDLSNLTTLNVKNCPIMTGLKSVIENSISKLVPTGKSGRIFYDILNKWIPSSPLTKIDIDVYGDLSDYGVLDACSILHENYGTVQRRINFNGKIIYQGSNIPHEYSTYEDYFPNLKVEYPNVNDVSSMFKDYNNINSIITKQIRHVNVETEQVYYETKYYWKDLRESDFDSRLFDIIDGNKYRPIEVYDQKDQDYAAFEIKKRLDPFRKTEPPYTTLMNMTSMFENCKYLEKILPQTFDGINVKHATNANMFKNCINLKYIECPRFDHLDSMVFNDCNNAIIWIPNTVKFDKIDSYAFLTNSFLLGKHMLVLFEAPYAEAPTILPYARDCRFNVNSYNDANGYKRAMKTEIIECPNISKIGQELQSFKKENLCLQYFNNDLGKLIYNVSNYTMDGSTIIPNKTPINFSTWNMSIESDNYYSNPLNIYEMLYGSMQNFDTNEIMEMAIPTFDIHNLSIGYSMDLCKEECSLLKLFFNTVETHFYQYLPKLAKLYLLFDKHTKLSEYFLEDSTATHVFCSNQLTEIKKNAFKNSNLSEIHYTNADDVLATTDKLVKIQEFAFENTKLTNIYIPNSVIEIGEGAFSNNMHVQNIHYSENMTYVPILCFANCNHGPNIPSVVNVGGFTNKITEFQRNAFDKANIELVKSDQNSDDEYNCYWCGDPSKSKFLDYFTNLKFIDAYSFRGVKNIKSLNITPNIKLIGDQAFAEIGETLFSTKIKWDQDTSLYNNLDIGNMAFSGRSFDWESFDNLPNGKPLILKNTVFIPKSVKTVGSRAFSPSSNDHSSRFNIRFVLSDIEKIGINWNDYFSTGELHRIYNFDSALNYNDQGIESLYLLLKDKTALYAKLLSPNATTISLPASITKVATNENYDLVQILDEAFYDNDTVLNAIYFKDSDNKYKLKSIGQKWFKTENISNITFENSNLTIPSSVESIGSGTPFKKTTWFKNQLLDDFVYLNNICLGYSKNTKTLPQAILEGKKIKSTTKMIYDFAFNGEAITKIDLPESLIYINTNAFDGCQLLENIDFTPCANSLENIGNYAFKNNILLKKIHYTPKLRHVGFGAFNGCNGITSIEFENGCDLDKSSQPFSPMLDINGLNTTITDLKISSSMGSFFSPVGRGNAELSLLSNLKHLVLGEYEIINLPHGEGEYESKYKLDFSQYYDNAYYQELDTSEGAAPDTYINVPIILYVDDPQFCKPNETYHEDIDISNIQKDLLKEEDVVRIILGYLRNQKFPNTILAKSDFVIKSGASKYRKLFNNRVTVVQP